MAYEAWCDLVSSKLANYFLTTRPLPELQLPHFPLKSFLLPQGLDHAVLCLKSTPDQVGPTRLQISTQVSDSLILISSCIYLSFLVFIRGTFYTFM